MADSDNPSNRPQWQVGAAVAAWLLPGLGHVLLGERRRGLLVMAAIASLYLAGLLIGGLDVVDSQEDTLWFAAQSIAGPATLAVNHIHLAHLKPDAHPDRGPYVRSVGRVNEMGTLYCAMAGLLNLLVIIDVLYRLEDGGETHTPAPALRGRIVQREGTDA